MATVGVKGLTNVNNNLDKVGADVEDGGVSWCSSGHCVDWTYRGSRSSAIADSSGTARLVICQSDAAVWSTRLGTASTVARRVSLTVLVTRWSRCVMVAVSLERWSAQVAGNPEMKSGRTARRLRRSGRSHQSAAVDRMPTPTQSQVHYVVVVVASVRMRQRWQDGATGARATRTTVSVYRDRQIALHHAPRVYRRSYLQTGAARSSAMCDR